MKIHPCPGILFCAQVQQTFALPATRIHDPGIRNFLPQAPYMVDFWGREKVFLQGGITVGEM